MRRADVAHARMNSVHQLWDHPVLTERDRRRQIQTPGGPMHALRPPALSGVESMAGDVPRLGAHSREILHEMGFTDSDIGALVSAGVTTT